MGNEEMEGVAWRFNVQPLAFIVHRIIFSSNFPCKNDEKSVVLLFFMGLVVGCRLYVDLNWAAYYKLFVTHAGNEVMKNQGKLPPFEINVQPATHNPPSSQTNCNLFFHRNLHVKMTKKSINGRWA